VLRAAGLLVESGAPLSDAVLRAAPAAAESRTERRVRAAAERVAAGGESETLWRPLPLCAVDRLRLASAHERLGAVMGEVAQGMLVRWRTRTDACLAWLHPVAVVAVGIVVFLDVRAVLGAMESARNVGNLW
jgi:type II secretory pathway component PulF